MKLSKQEVLDAAVKWHIAQAKRCGAIPQQPVSDPDCVDLEDGSVTLRNVNGPLVTISFIVNEKGKLVFLPKEDE